MKQCVIAIPIYNSNPPKSEIASFKQVLTILGKHDITIFTYYDIDLAVYENIALKLNRTFFVEYFNKFYFDSVQSYNKLCLSKDFYLRFSQYEYMLIYQLDAWVFRDELTYWCDKGYDYIGAPLFWPVLQEQNIYKMSYVGNGGLSLRKISYCIKVLSKSSYLPYLKPTGIFRIYYNNNWLPASYIKKIGLIKQIPFILLKLMGFKNNLHYMYRSFVNEDMILSCYAKYAWGINVHLPSLMEASRFSFETHPSFLFRLNGGNLPFGCHAFQKYEYHSFWKKYIQY